MAKVSKVLDELQKKIDELNGKFGINTIIDMSKGADMFNVETITTGLPSLDVVLGKGIPKGRLVEIFGLESSGKTTMALHMVAKCQKEGKKALFIDVEHALDPAYAEKLGVNMKELLITQPDSGEDALLIIEKLCEDVGVIVVDSVAALIPASEEAKEIDATIGMASRARMLSAHLPKIVRAASRSGCVVIFINQVRMNIGTTYGNPEVTMGGLALKYAASIRIRVSALKAEERNGMEGTPIKVFIKKNKVGNPFTETELFLVYGKGFDIIYDLIMVAEHKSILKRGGPYYYFIWDENTKYQGVDKLYKALVEDEKLILKLRKTLETGEL